MAIYCICVVCHTIPTMRSVTTYDYVLALTDFAMDKYFNLPPFSSLYQNTLLHYTSISLHHRYHAQIQTIFAISHPETNKTFDFEYIVSDTVPFILTPSVAAEVAKIKGRIDIIRRDQAQLKEQKKTLQLQHATNLAQYGPLQANIKILKAEMRAAGAYIKNLDVHRYDHLEDSEQKLQWQFADIEEKNSYVQASLDENDRNSNHFYFMLNELLPYNTVNTSRS